VLAGASSASIGLVEDIWGLRDVVRAALAFAVGLLIGGLASSVLDVSAFWAVVGAFACLGGVNVVNFMDGVNGISALHALISGGAFVWIGLIEDAPWLVISGAILATVFAAFLPWNLSGKMFLGDVGSYLLGGTIAIVVLIGWMQRLPLVALAAPMSIYVIDTGVTLLARAARGERWREAHRDHTYQRLHQKGLTHVQVSGLVGACSATCASLGIVASTHDGGVRAASWAGLILVMAGYAVLRYFVDSDSLQR
jgi:UDP-N-acetylmuramyl pentapeptide phosphotransferase/UDP-N-acetylglucosamine-1-phosphate transferase